MSAQSSGAWLVDLKLDCLRLDAEFLHGRERVNLELVRVLVDVLRACLEVEDDDHALWPVDGDDICGAAQRELTVFQITDLFLDADIAASKLLKVADRLEVLAGHLAVPLGEFDAFLDGADVTHRVIVELVAVFRERVDRCARLRRVT